MRVCTLRKILGANGAEDYKDISENQMVSDQRPIQTCTVDRADLRQDGQEMAGRIGRYTKKPRRSVDLRGFRKTAATYSPTWWGSTIGDGELNFSVRNGKRWFLTAITTAVCYLREYFRVTVNR